MKDQKASSSFSTPLASEAEPWEAPVHHQCCHTQACRVSPVSPVQVSPAKEESGNRSTAWVLLPDYVAHHWAASMKSGTCF